MMVEVEMKENLPMARFALVVKDVSMLLRMAWMSVEVVEEKKIMMELYMGKVGERKAARHLT